MNESFKCARCTKCCRTYWITMLPAEAASIAKLLEIPLPKFLEKYCVLFLQAFPSQKSISNPLVVPLGSFPKKLSAKISRKTSASFLLLLPGIALKRKKKTCIMLSKGFECKIHLKRPGQCDLFPLIGLNESQDLKNAYSFCKGLKGFEKPSLKANRKHYLKVKEYFESVKLKGFKKVWKEFPSKGVLLLDKEKVSDILGKEFFKILGT